MTDTITEAEDGGTPGPADPAGASQPHKEPHHIRRMVVIWPVPSRSPTPCSGFWWARTSRPAS